MWHVKYPHNTTIMPCNDNGHNIISLYRIWLGKLEVHEINNVYSGTASLVIGLCAIYIKLRVPCSPPWLWYLRGEANKHRLHGQAWHPERKSCDSARQKQKHTLAAALLAETCVNSSISQCDHVFLYPSIWLQLYNDRKPSYEHVISTFMLIFFLFY